MGSFLSSQDLRSVSHSSVSPHIHLFICPSIHHLSTHPSTKAFWGLACGGVLSFPCPKKGWDWPSQDQSETWSVLTSSLEEGLQVQFTA